MFSIKNKTVLLTGATGGIGNEIAHQMSSLGAKLILTGTKKDRLNDLSNKLPNESDFIVSNLNTNENVQNFSDELENKNYIIDILINNAGITKDNLLMRMTEEDYDSVMEVNMKSVFNMTKACQRTFLKNKKGSIINMSSVVGVKGNAGQSNYAASKAAIIGFSKSIAIELGSRNIRCNVIAPGFIKTEMTDKLSEEVIQSWNKNIPLKRPGESEDVANLCLFLASDLSHYITGQVINVDGGLLT